MSIKLQVTLSPEQHDALKENSVALNMSMAQLLRMCAAQFFSDFPRDGLAWGDASRFRLGQRAGDDSVQHLYNEDNEK